MIENYFIPQNHFNVECVKCNKKIAVTPSKETIKTLPAHLIIILNRFDYDKNQSKSTKVATYIPLSLTLNLKEVFLYLPDNSTYELYSIVVHKVIAIKKMEN